MDRDVSHYPGLLQPGIGCWYGKFWLVQHNSLNRTSKKSHGSRWESTLTSRRRAPECRGCNFPGHWWISFPRKSSRRDRTGDGQGKKHKNPRMGFQPHPFPWVVPNPIPLPNQIILGIRRPFGKAGNLFQVEFIARRKKKIKEEIQFHLEDFIHHPSHIQKFPGKNTQARFSHHFSRIFLFLLICFLRNGWETALGEWNEQPDIPWAGISLRKIPIPEGIWDQILVCLRIYMEKLPFVLSFSLILGNYSNF